MFNRSRSWVRGLSLAALAAGAVSLSAPRAALAEVRHEGEWSDDDPEVTLDLDGVPRADAVNRLAAAAGWSVVIRAPKSDPVTVHVKDQPAGKVLALLLTDGRYVARRDDKLIAIAPDDAAAAEAPAPPLPPAAPMMPAPPLPPLPPLAPLAPLPPLAPAAPAAPSDVESDEEGHDRLVTGGNLRIEKGEVVHDATVMGGNLDVWGTVTGDISVAGGNARIHSGAHVKGGAGTVGGNLTLESGAAVDGDVGVVGGVLRREDGARVGGDIHEGTPKKGRSPRPHKGHEATKGVTSSSSPSWLSQIADALNHGALLFVFGAVLLALAPDRMEKIKVQIAAHPARSFATGVVALFAGALAAVVVSLTVIGIPVAVVGILAAVLGTFAGVCCVFETVGCALLGHRTRNPYVHLACGGLLFVLASAIPKVGGLVDLVVGFTAFGALVITRGAGLVPLKGRFTGSPYRDAGTTST